MGVPILGISGPHLGVPRQNDIWVPAPWLGTWNIIRGKVVASFKSRLWWILWVYVCPWLICAPKVSSYALTNFFGLCRSMWVIDLVVNLPSPHLGALACPFYRWSATSQGARHNSFSFHCCQLWICSWIHQGAWGCIISLIVDDPSS